MYHIFISFWNRSIAFVKDLREFYNFSAILHKSPSYFCLHKSTCFTYSRKAYLATFLLKILKHQLLQRSITCHPLRVALFLNIWQTTSVSIKVCQNRSASAISSSISNYVAHHRPFCLFFWILSKYKYMRMQVYLWAHRLMNSSMQSIMSFMYLFKYFFPYPKGLNFYKFPTSLLATNLRS